MTDNCTCADHGTFITTDPACPIHGHAEMARRHGAAAERRGLEATRQLRAKLEAGQALDESSIAAWYKSLTDAQRERAWALIDLLEGERHV